MKPIPSACEQMPLGEGEGGAEVTVKLSLLRMFSFFSASAISRVAERFFSCGSGSVEAASSSSVASGCDESQ